MPQIPIDDRSNTGSGLQVMAWCRQLVRQQTITWDNVDLRRVNSLLNFWYRFFLWNMEIIFYLFIYCFHFPTLSHWSLGNLNEFLTCNFQTDFSDWWLRHFLWNYPINMNVTDFTDDQSTLVQLMDRCHQATSHYLSQCWPRSLSPYGVTRPQCVNSKKRTCFSPILGSIVSH